jgi:hypothetical protein
MMNLKMPGAKNIEIIMQILHVQNLFIFIAGLQTGKCFIQNKWMSYPYLSYINSRHRDTFL